MSTSPKWIIMQFDNILIGILSIAGIVFTYWFFLMKKEEIVLVEQKVDVLVKGGYLPSIISIPKDKSTTINFLRTDASSCLEEVVLGDFRIRKFLPLNKKISIEITPKKAGEFSFTCVMNMFNGKVILKY